MNTSIETRIRGAYNSLASGPGAWIRLTYIFWELPNVPRVALKEALCRLAHERDVEMKPESNQKTLNAEDRCNTVQVGGRNVHLIAIDPRRR